MPNAGRRLAKSSAGGSARRGFASTRWKALRTCLGEISFRAESSEHRA